MNETIIAALFDYFDNCPLLGGGRLNVNYLPEDTEQAGIEYSIDNVPADDLIYQYLRGRALKRYVFIIGSINEYGPDAAQNIANTGFFEKLSKWIDEQNQKKNFPILPEGLESTKIKALGSGYLYQPDVNAGKYQIQCELQYYQ